MNHPAFKNEFVYRNEIQNDEFQKLVRNYVVKTWGGDGKFVPESLRTLDLKSFFSQKTTRTKMDNLIGVEEDEDDHKNKPNPSSKFEQIKEYYMNKNKNLNSQGKYDPN